VVTGPGWTLAGLLGLVAAVTPAGSLAWYRVSVQAAVFLVVLAAGYGLEHVAAARTGRRSLPRALPPVQRWVVRVATSSDPASGGTLRAARQRVLAEALTPAGYGSDTQIRLEIRRIVRVSARHYRCLGLVMPIQAGPACRVLPSTAPTEAERRATRRHLVGLQPMPAGPPRRQAWRTAGATTPSPDNALTVGFRTS
jgi:hypothetical protein